MCVSVKNNASVHSLVRLSLEYVPRNGITG